MIDAAKRTPEIRILIWLAIALAAVGLVTLTAPLLASFSGLATIFFLAWLLAFLVRPLALWVSRLLAWLPFGAAVGVAYVLVGIVTGIVIAVVAISLGQSIQQLTSTSSLVDRLVARLAPLQAQLEAAGLGSINPADWLSGAVGAVDLGSAQSLETFGIIAGSLAGALGTLSIVVFMSVYIAAERDQILAGVRRTVPARYHRGLDIVQEAISHSFGGFVRGQIFIGILYGLIAFGACLLLGLPYAPLVGVTVAVLQTIPYFGQLVSWAPPVVVAVLFQPEAALPALIIMAVGLLLLVNLVQPRVIGTSVGLSPLAVLAAVLIGGQLAGVLGAVFAVPVAAAGLAIYRRLAADELRVEPGEGPTEPPTTEPQPIEATAQG